MAIPGIVMRDGHVMRALFLDWHDVPFLDLIAEDLARFGAPSLENDANALAMGEVIRGHVSPNDMNERFFSMDVGVGGIIKNPGISALWRRRSRDPLSRLLGPSQQRNITHHRIMPDPGHA